MSLESLNNLAPGLCDGEDQTANVIVNVDSADADENGLPVDTSEVPEADLGEADSSASDAVAAATVADDAAQAGDGLEKVEEALETAYRERRGLTKTETQLVAVLTDMSTDRLYRNFDVGTRQRAVLGAGIEAFESGGFAQVAAGLEENKKGVVETIKSFIKKVIEFFKGIFKSIQHYLSGSKKLAGRADEIIKRANENKGGTAKGNISFNGIDALKVSGQTSVSSISAGVKALNSFADNLLDKGTGWAVVAAGLQHIEKFTHGEKEEAAEGLKSTISGGVAKLNATLGSSGAGQNSRTLIGGLQVGVVNNPEQFRVTLFSKTVDAKGAEQLPALDKAGATQFATAAKELIAKVTKYQGEWRERENGRKAIEGMLEGVAKEASGNYAKSTEDGFAKKFQTKRRIAQSVASNMMGVIGTEARVVSHTLRVSSALLAYADKSLKALGKDAEEAAKKAKDGEKK